ncbi:MAG TPA: hypothetical protein VHG28_23590 [Longimicrobiaceae bacterium]|nr:hypothetical protein [Longimicrobiaceae bacterium]
MKRLLASALTAAVVAAGTGSVAQAQEMTGRRASLFDLGIYAGGAWTSSWFEIQDEGFQVGLSPIFGATATYWATPSFGVRLHGAYFPSSLPEAETDIDGGDNWPMNNWLYDLDLVFRPFFWNEGGGMMSSMYFFLGGGGLTTNIAGNPTPPGGVGFPCVAAYRAAGVCLSQDPEYASVGQGVAGLGFDLFPLGTGMGVFGELAVHGYDSPAHVYNEQISQDKFAFTPRAVLGLKFMFGGAEPEPVIVPPVVPPTIPEPVVPPPPATQEMQVCVVQGNMLTTVTATYNPATGDTTVAGGQRFSEAYPATAGYAAGATWYINNDTITFNGQRYQRFGLSRVVGTTEVTRAGEFQGVGIFTETGATGTPEMIYVPVRPGCEFQPYQRVEAIRRVRG